MDSCASFKILQYCSKDCAAKDWKSRAKGGLGQGHKEWCKIGGGEEGVDWEVRLVSSEKGQGLFAMRDFARHERILVERTFELDELQSGPPGPQAEFSALMPADGSSLDKFNLNCLGAGSSQENAVGLRHARSNHACRPNAYHYFEPVTRVKILITREVIAKGDEITHSYVHDLTLPAATFMLQEKWGIFCPDDCACKDVSWINQLATVEELDKQGVNQLQKGEAKEALRSVHELLAFEETLDASAITRTLYVGFQAAIALGQVPEALVFAKQGLALAETSFGPSSENALKYKPLVENPTQHRLYKVMLPKGIF
jgi:hypothetical protein